MTEYVNHPASALFPMLSDSELQQLAEDIKANGLLDPVVLYHGEVLDGRNRLAACKLVGIEPRFDEVNGEIASPTIYVISKNLHRRHLTQSQRAAVAAEAVPTLQEEARKRQLSGTLAPIGTKGKAAEIAAKAAAVGSRSVQRAIQVKRDDPEAFAKVRTGELTVWEASQEKHSGAHAPRVVERDSYVPDTPRKLVVAESYKRKMIAGLSQMTGLCRGLSELNVAVTLSVCSVEDVQLWSDRANELSGQLRAFANKLKKGTPNGNHDTRQGNEEQAN